MSSTSSFSAIDSGGDDSGKTNREFEAECDTQIGEDAEIKGTLTPDLSTTFDSRDAPLAQREKYKKLAEYNDGLRACDNTTARRRADYRRDFQCWASQLELPEYMRNRCERILFEEIDRLDRFGKDAEVVIMATISLVANREDWAIQSWPDEEERIDGVRYGPPSSKEYHDTHFKELCVDIGVTLSNLNNARNVLREEFF